MTRFKHFLGIDWSGAKGKRQAGIALALCDAGGGPPVLVERGRNWAREEVLGILRDDLPPDTLIGCDLGISLPFTDCGAFFPRWDGSPPDARSLWAAIDDLCADDPDLTAQSFIDHPSVRPHYREGDIEGAHFRCDGAAHGRGRFRVTEAAQAAMGCKPYSNFNLVGAAQVGKSSLTGMRMLHQLGPALPVWPIDPLPASGPVLVEIYTSLAAMAAGRSAAKSKIRTYKELSAALATLDSPPVTGSGPIDDHSSDAILTAAWLRKVANRKELWSPAALTKKIAATEGWTFGAV